MPSKVRNPDVPSNTFRWKKEWRRDRDNGIKRLATPDAAQAHVQELIQRHGVTVRAIADTAGVSPDAISHLSRGLKKSLMATTEKKILAVTAQSIFNRPNPVGFVPNIGARRRVRALLAIGWRHTDLSAKAGFSTGTLLSQVGDWISKRKHDAVKAVYDELWSTQGPSTRRPKGPDYAPPLAWDDDTIDDPAATPDLGIKVAKQGRPSKKVEKVSYLEAIAEDVDFLARTGATTEEIAERTGSDWASIERSLYRASRGDLVTTVKTQIRDNARKAGRTRRAA